MQYRKVPVLALLLALIAIPLAAAERRNVVLFVSDDHGLDAGCYGNRAIRTPALDRLAEDGTLFLNAYATTASCSASRSVILTGLQNHANGQYGHAHAAHHFRAKEDTVSLPARLSRAGYRTALIGKLHVAPESLFPFDRTIPGNSRNAVEMAERCREFVGEASEKPFFLYFCPTDPHRSGDRAEDLPGRPDRFGNPPPGKTRRGVTPVAYDPKDVEVPPFLPDSPECRAELAQYYQSVTRLDQGLGRLVEVLKEAGVWDETLFIYISDNGMAFPGAKTTVYEPGIRLPCIARRPGDGPRGVRSRAMVSWTDLAPTILDFAGIDPGPAKLHGRSFLEILGMERPAGWDEVYASHTFHEITMYYPMRVVRAGSMKLIWNIAHPLPYPFASDLHDSATWQTVLARGDGLYGKRTVKAYIHRPPFELYDLEKDPDEVRNLAGDPASAAILEELKGKLRRFQETTGDPWVLKWKYE